MIKNSLKKLIPSRMHTEIGNFITKLKNYPKFIYFKVFNNEDFIFNNKKYKYHIALHNTTFLNERIIEIPIILDLIKKYEGKRILEVGNVLSNYSNFKHDIVDKYEKGNGVLNFDIVDFVPKENYDLIVSISTFEHIGFDEVIRYDQNSANTVKNDSVIKAIEYTKNLLNPGGLFIFTIPLGYNSFLDSQLHDKKLNLTEEYFLSRKNSKNEWEQIQYEEIKNAKYGSPYMCANTILVGIFKK